MQAQLFALCLRPGNSLVRALLSAGTQYLGEDVLADSFFVEEDFDETVKLFTGAGQQCVNCFVAVLQQPLDLLVDLGRGRFAVFSSLREIVAQKRLVIVCLKGH